MTTLRKRAAKLLKDTFGDTLPGPAIVELVNFASQNGGLEPRNYYDPFDLKNGRRDTYAQGVKAYNSELRSINADWVRFKKALIEAAADRVTEEQVIEAAKSAFSGRLTWEPYGKKGEADQGHVWHYTTGQYFPTEYRKAAASVLEYAAREARRSRPEVAREVESIEDLTELNRQNGGCWFEPDTMSFFGTQIETEIIQGKYFVTSEQPPHGPRKFTLRSFDQKGRVNTVGEFCAYDDKDEALNAIPELVPAA